MKITKHRGIGVDFCYIKDVKNLEAFCACITRGRNFLFTQKRGNL